MVRTLENTLAEKYLTINSSKTKVMVVGKDISKIVNLNINVNGKSIKQVSQFTYLGSLITNDGRYNKEARSRISLAKQAFNKRKHC